MDQKGYRMASEIGHIKSVEGAVKVIGADGIEKVVVAGEAVFENDVVITGAAGNAILELENGHTVEVGADEQLSLDSSVSTEVAVDDTVVGDVATLQASLLAGEELDPTAAGPGGGGALGSLHEGAVYDARTDDRGDVKADQTPDNFGRAFPDTDLDVDQAILQKVEEPVPPEPAAPEPVAPVTPVPPSPPVITVLSVTSDTQTEGTPENNLVHTVTLSGQTQQAVTYSFSLLLPHQII